MTVQKLADNPGGKAADAAEPKQGVYGGITVEELSSKWKEAVLELTKKGVAVTNEKSALEGALTIRYNYRQILGSNSYSCPCCGNFDVGWHS